MVTGEATALAGEGVLSSWALPIERSGVEEK